MPKHDSLAPTPDDVARRRRPKTAATREAPTPEAAPAAAPPAWTTLALADQGAPLDSGTRSELQPRFAQQLPDVRIHQGPAADAAARAADALAFTVGRDVAFRDGAYAPGSAEGRGLLAHELAHTVQNAGAPPSAEEVSSGHEPAEAEADRAAAAVQAGGPASVQAVPAARVQRQRHGGGSRTARQPAAPTLEGLTVPSARPIDIPQATVDEFFQRVTSGNYGTTLPLPAGATLRLVGIPAEHATPMTSIAMWLAQNNTYTSPSRGTTLPLFAVGNVITVHLDLSAHGLPNGEYRFAWAGDATRSTVTIEALSGATAPVTSPAVTPQSTAATQGGTQGEQGQTQAQPAAAAVVPASTTISAGGATFTLATPWPRARFDHLMRALSLIPAPALRAVDGLSFAVGSFTGPEGEDGNYDPERHRVTMFERAWSGPDALRFRAEPWAVYAIVHEIGHAVDLAPLRAAWGQYSSSPNRSEAQARAAERTLAGVRSQSGSSYVLRDGTFEMEDPRTGVTTDFRTAAAQDGVTAPRGATTLAGGPTEYAAKGWQDLYAESFALYNTDPDLLQRTRPHIFAYFRRRFPR